MKLKFQQNNIELHNNSQDKTDIKFVFSFNEELLVNAKKHTVGFKISKLDDLSNNGTVARLNDGQIIVVSLGEKNRFNFPAYIKALESVMHTIKTNSKLKSISFVVEDSLAKTINQTVSEFTENSIFYLFNHLYYYDNLKSAPKKLSLKLVNVITAQDQSMALGNAINLTDAVFMVRDLAHGPANLVTPTMLAKTAMDFEKISKKVKIEILEEKDAKKLKMNAFLAVAQGTEASAKFIKMEYFGATKNKKPIVLIGKGITFDSGGISMKPTNNMDKMKYDMCGAATVIGIFHAAAKLELPINLVCLVPSCENMPSGRAVKPGDVVTTMSGKTVEILNTDAEGRLVLCDALTYAKQYKPELVIDMATLTGACITALGTVASALYSNNEPLAEQLIKSANHTDDKVWRMPLFKEYHDMLKGTVADLSNITDWKPDAGSATAACFLEEFTDYKWAHLDIAGTAMGGSGRPFYMMMNFLRNYKS